MVLCLSALAGCGVQTTTVNYANPEYMEIIRQGVPQTLDSLTSLTDEELDEEIEYTAMVGDAVGYQMFTEWKSYKDELGMLIGGEIPDVTYENGQYVARMRAVFENRGSEFTVYVDNDLAITSISFDPEYTLGERLSKAAMNTLMGMGIVFAMLLFMCWIISRFKYISVIENWFNKRKTSKDEGSEAPEEISPPEDAEAAVQSEIPSAVYADAGEEALTISSDETENEDEIVAAVIAAITAASEDETAGSENSANTCNNGLVVRSIKRASNKSRR